ncbi:hydantoinase/oxoprolinase family protein [Actinomadura parmotrematis]|uniref:Hydantoinase/oxoprolinase family protein n=1 Tax=Actinomadura parmotrematis TaxID=2864039 RepID=A0ABS7FLN5_9ACTN|nr:hydantoinase/oxoprolinase family protein [Actinomadura parmotrematis]MBW8481259.1 hydantoinase/oxoprolinase family protein [Actinomadura parmotrematis]
MTHRIAVDVGGTFTDLALLGPDGVELVHKTGSTPAEPSDGLVAGLGGLAAKAGLPLAGLLARTDALVHGTTITTNALVTGTGARTGLLATEGLRDVLLARQGSRADQFDSRTAPPPPLVPRHLIETVAGRLDRTGAEAVPLDEDGVRRAARRFRAAGVEAVAVCFVFSYLDGGHERRAAEILAAELPGVFLSVSSRVAPEVRLYERTSTTVLNAYVGPVLRAHLDRLSGRLAGLGYTGRVLVVQSNGGVADMERAAERAVGTLLSGPAGAPAAVAAVTAELGVPDAMAIDMGGTSFEVSLSSGGATGITTRAEPAGHPVSVPMLDIATIGAGGGSIARTTPGGLLRVGPASAGADPGPACYGRGGGEPTVTDADLLLGYLAGGFGDGLEPSADLARDALAGLGRRLGLGPVEAAAGVHRAVNAEMADSLRLAIARHGLDPHRLALVAAGGAGPVHAAELARDLEIPLVVVPAGASVLCARGMLRADLVRHYVHTLLGRDPRAAATDPAEAEAAFARLEGDAARDLPVDAGLRFTRLADVRYVGQVHEVTVPFPDGPGVDAAALAGLLARFHRLHERLYGFAQPEVPTELVNLRLEARSPTLAPDAAVPAAPPGPERDGTRRAWFDGAFREVPVRDVGAVPVDERQEGPALLAGEGTTTVVPPGFAFEITASGTVLLFGADRDRAGVLAGLRGARPEAVR